MQDKDLDRAARLQVKLQERALNILGCELHDNIGQLLVTAKMFLALAEQTMDNVSPEIRFAHETLANAISEVRSLSKLSNSEWLKQFSLQQNLGVEANRINSCGGIVMRLNMIDFAIPLSPDAQVMIFRIIQEAIQNTIKHAHANNMDIKITQIEKMIEISIIDDGNGFIAQQGKCESVGILNMKYRARLLNGRINWVSSPGTGTKVTISIPCQ